MDPKNKMSRSDWEEYTKRYGLLGQQNYIEEKEREKREKEEERREAAALAIQITWRRYIKKRREKEEKEEKELKEKMEWNYIQEKERERREKEEEEDEKREAERREGAVLTIQRRWRKHIRERREAAVLTLQRGWRKHIRERREKEEMENETRESEERTQMPHSEEMLSEHHVENCGSVFVEKNKKEGEAREDEEEDRQRKAKEESEKERMRRREELIQTFARRERNVRLHQKPPLLSPKNRLKKLGKRIWNFLTGRPSPSRVEADGGDKRGGAQRRERQEEDFKELSPQEEMRGGTWTISPEHNDNDGPEK